MRKQYDWAIVIPEHNWHRAIWHWPGGSSFYSRLDQHSYLVGSVQGPEEVVLLLR